MNKPQRYDPDFRIGALYMDESDDGDYVEYEDYAILADRLARLTAELERSRRECEGLRFALCKVVPLDNYDGRRRIAEAALDAIEAIANQEGDHVSDA